MGAGHASLITSNQPWLYADPVSKGQPEKVIRGWVCYVVSSKRCSFEKGTEKEKKKRKLPSQSYGEIEPMTRLSLRAIIKREYSPCDFSALEKCSIFRDNEPTSGIDRYTIRVHVSMRWKHGRIRRVISARISKLFPIVLFESSDWIRVSCFLG